jgi:NADH:ubiquinone oxidoreductase subunit 5 (subunit L)/multisubunit Na+/H+ antiporter MnhA subunit
MKRKCGKLKDRHISNTIRKLKKMIKRLGPLNIISIASPILLTGVFFYCGMELHTGEMLTLFLSIVWGVLVAIGGAIVFLRTFNFQGNAAFLTTQKKSHQKAINLCLILLVEAMLFLILSLFYPTRHLLRKKIEFVQAHYNELGNLYDSMMFSLIIVPSICSVFIGIWCIYLVLNSEHE